MVKVKNELSNSLLFFNFKDIFPLFKPQHRLNFVSFLTVINKIFNKNNFFTGKPLLYLKVISYIAYSAKFDLNLKISLKIKKKNFRQCFKQFLRTFHRDFIPMRNGLLLILFSVIEFFQYFFVFNKSSIFVLIHIIFNKCQWYNYYSIFLKINYCIGKIKNWFFTCVVIEWWR